MPDGKSADHASESLAETAAPLTAPKGEAPIAQPSTAKPAEKRPRWMWIAGGMLGVLILIEGIPRIITAFKTVSTDDAYVNGHVTFVAARVPGQVVRVLVDDNNRVRKGKLLVQLDKEPYQVKVDIAQAGLAVAQADLVADTGQGSRLGGVGAQRMVRTGTSVEGLNNQVADLHASVAALQAANARLTKAQADYGREKQLYEKQVISRQEFDTYQEALSVAKAQSEKAQQDVYEIRATLGLSEKPARGETSAMSLRLSIKLFQGQGGPNPARADGGPTRVVSFFRGIARRDARGILSSAIRPAISIHSRAASQGCPGRQAGGGQAERRPKPISSRPN